MGIIGYVASLLMGITLGLLGGGGSIMTVPILVYLFKVTPTVATGYSLFVVGITALIGSAMYYRKGEIDLKVGLSFGLPSIAGVSFSRGWLVPRVPSVVAEFGDFVMTKEIFVMIAFAALMIFASSSMIRVRKVHKPSTLPDHLRLVVLALNGLIVGVIAGFVGAGGGFLIIPALVFVAKLPMRLAVGTSLFIIASQSLLGFSGDVIRGTTVDWALLETIAATAAVGIALGSSLSHKMKEQKLKVAFGWFVLAMGAAILVEQVRHI